MNKNSIEKNSEKSIIELNRSLTRKLMEQKNALSAEAFAHFAVSKYSNNESLELIKKYFSKSLEIYDEIIKVNVEEKYE